MMTQASAGSTGKNPNVEQLKKIGSSIADAVLPDAKAAVNAGSDYMNRNAPIEADKPATELANEAVKEETFVDPAPVQAERAPATPQIGSDSTGAGLFMEANAIDKLGKEQSKVYGGLQEQIAGVDKEAQALQAEQKVAHKAFEDEDRKVTAELDSFKYKPFDYFSGKSTWQKVVGGIGMFLGSITPQGARNVAEIINKEMDADIERQKLGHQLLKDKKSNVGNAFARKMELFKDERLAKLSLKQSMLAAADLNLKQLESSSKGEIARSKATQGREALQMEKEKNFMAAQKIYAEIAAKQDASTIPGFKGTIKDPTAAREFRKLIGEAPIVKREIENLLGINKKFLGGALSSDARASAEQSQRLLIGKMREALVGPGSMSEGDRGLMQDAIANPTDFFSLKGSNKIKLDKLLKAYNDKINSDAAAYGLSRPMPSGARKLN